METVIYKQLIDENRLKIPSELSKEEIQKIISKDNAREILKIAMDNKGMVCSLNINKIWDLSCSFYITNPMILESSYYSNDEVRISIKDANGLYFTTEELISLGYGSVGEEERWAHDFYKNISKDDLRKELLKYIEKLEVNIERELEISDSKTDQASMEMIKFDKLRTDIMLEYLEEVLE